MQKQCSQENDYISELSVDLIVCHNSVKISTNITVRSVIWLPLGSKKHEKKGETFIRCFISSDDLVVLRFQNLRFCEWGEVFEKPALKAPHPHSDAVRKF